MHFRKPIMHFITHPRFITTTLCLIALTSLSGCRKDEQPKPIVWEKFRTHLESAGIVEFKGSPTKEITIDGASHSSSSASNAAGSFGNAKGRYPYSFPAKPGMWCTVIPVKSSTGEITPVAIYQEEGKSSKFNGFIPAEVFRE